MSKFFIGRPIVAMVISILMVIVGVVTIASLPVSQLPSIAPPEVLIQANYVGADSQTVEQSVATPIEQQMSGVDNLNYMYSLNAANGQMTMIVDFDVKTDPNTDLILTQMRQTQAASQLPTDVTNYGVTVQKSVTAPLMVIGLYSPHGTYDAQFLANYAYINLNDQLTRVPGIGNVQVFGAGQYAMRLWVKPDQLAKLGITVPEILSAIQSQNAVNPAGRVGGAPVPKGQEYTYSVRAQGRLTTPEEFGNIMLREMPDGGIVRVNDVAHRAGLARLQRDRTAERETERDRGGLPAPRHQCGAGSGRREKIVGGSEKPLSPGHGLRYFAGHDASGHGRHEGHRGHAADRDRTGNPRRLSVPSGLARDADSAARSARLADRNFRSFPCIRFFDQHLVLIRSRAGHRTCGR